MRDLYLIAAGVAASSSHVSSPFRISKAWPVICLFYIIINNLTFDGTFLCVSKTAQEAKYQSLYLLFVKASWRSRRCLGGVPGSSVACSSVAVGFRSSPAWRWLYLEAWRKVFSMLSFFFVERRLARVYPMPSPWLPQTKEQVTH